MSAKAGLLTSLAMLLVGCGGGAKLGGGKEGAAAALFAASGPTKVEDQGLRAPGGLPIPPVQGALGVTVTVQCRFGGTASLEGIQSDIGAGGEISQSFKLVYRECASSRHEGVPVPLDGSLTVTQTLTVSGTGGAVIQTFEGHVHFGGPFDDFIDADITQTVDWSVLDAGSGSVQVVLDGTISTSTGTYTFDEETITITAGVLVAAGEG